MDVMIPDAYTGVYVKGIWHLLWIWDRTRFFIPRISLPSAYKRLVCNRQVDRPDSTGGLYPLGLVRCAGKNISLPA